MWRFPTYGSIFYLTEIGGPTVIFPQRLSLANESDFESLMPRAHSTMHYLLIEPQRNSYAIFKGNLLHGVLRRDLDLPIKRQTFLVNFWKEHVPLEPACRVPQMKHGLLQTLATWIGSSPQWDCHPLFLDQSWSPPHPISPTSFPLNFDHLNQKNENQNEKMEKNFKFNLTSIDLQIGLPRWFCPSVFAPVDSLPPGLYEMDGSLPKVILWMEISNSLNDILSCKILFFFKKKN